MRSEDLTLQPSDVEKKEQSSIFTQFINLFFSPSKTFSSLKSKPKWAVPFLVCLVFGFLMLAAIDNPSWEKYKMIPEFITAQQLVLASAIVLLMHFVNVFGLSFFIWLGLQLYPVTTKFISILSVVSFSFLILIPETLMKLPLIFSKQTFDVYLSPVILLPSAWYDSPLFHLLKNFDIFTI